MKTNKDFLKYLQDRIKEYEKSFDSVEIDDDYIPKLSLAISEAIGALAELKHIEELARVVYRFGVDNE